MDEVTITLKTKMPVEMQQRLSAAIEAEDRDAVAAIFEEVFDGPLPIDAGFVPKKRKGRLCQNVRKPSLFSSTMVEVVGPGRRS